MPRYRVNYTADVWESVIVEADSKKHAKNFLKLMMIIILRLEKMSQNNMVWKISKLIWLKN